MFGRLATTMLFFCIMTHPESLLAADKPVSPKDSASKFTLPKGFSATLFAGEPDVVQPIAFTFDDRGRMWVIECMMYPKWSQDGKNGKDRVVILEDTDGDGVHDKKTIVIDHGVNLSGIELGFGGVYLCSSPNLIFVPIQNDKPAGKPEILLDGWNIKDAKHNIFNSLTWGPDGWLYGCNGIQTKSKVGKPGTPEQERIFFDCGVWRFHPTRKKFEVVANGTTNPFGLDFDQHGEMFITNCVIDHLWHVVPGGHYTRMYGNDPNPHVYGYMSSAVDYKHWGSGAWTDSRAGSGGKLKKEHDDAGGGHAHSGAAIYLSDNFPKEYRNTLFTCNIHGNRVNHDGLEPTAGGMKGIRRPDFLFANDPWFRGICVKVGPDGGLYISDWSDTGECHNYQTVDASNGRIYRVIHGKVKSWTGNIHKLDDAVLMQNALTSTNEWLARRCRLELQRRFSGGSIEREVVFKWMKTLPETMETPYKLRLYWILHTIGELTDANYAELINSSNDYLASWGIRLALDSGKATGPLTTKTLAAAAKAPISPRVHFTLLGAAQRVDPKIVHNWIAAGLLQTTSADRNLQLMMWYAAEKHIDGDDAYSRSVITSTNVGLVRSNIVRRYLRITRTNQGSALNDIMNDILEAKPDVQRDMLIGIKAAYADRPTAEALPQWSNLAQKANLSDEVRGLVDELSVKFGDEKQIARMKERIADTNANVAARTTAIRLLSQARTPGLAAALREALAEEAVRGAALRALASYADEATLKAILEVYPKLNSDEKADAVQTLASRPTFALALLGEVEKGAIPRSDINAFTARQILAHKNKSVVDKLKSVWGEVKPASAARIEQIAKYRDMLSPEQIKQANLANGRAVFSKNCASCHKLHGEGQIVGPDLTGSQRANLDYVLENVVDPSAVVANEYKMTNFFMTDGRVVSGIVRQETAISFTVRTINEEVIVVKKELDERKPTNQSIMPEGLLDSLKPSEVRDLIAYLANKEQVPLPK